MTEPVTTQRRNSSGHEDYEAYVEAQVRAELATRTMWATDKASQGLGLEIKRIAPGQATLTMVVEERMTNGHGMAHGGFIFALADSAFAFACNTSGDKTVTTHCAVTFLRPAQLGDLLVAEAREVSTAGRSGLYDVRVSVGDKVIAEFRGHSRVIGGSFIETANKQD
jgi:acyl-CoA thioesterase